MPKGVIKKIVSDRGFGFISSEGGSDVFFHHSAVADEGFDNLQEGQAVTYDVEDGGGGGGSRRGGGKGPRAANVKPA
ncbi:MAG: cold shock domain-containing protein [Pirellulales bacterium]|nr:cold shock domain-containing protein [Pirellulales bacterium]